MTDFSGLWNGFLDLLFPPKCPFCGTVLTRPGICADCSGALPWTTAENGTRTVRGLHCAAPLFYEGAVRNTLLGFKFYGRVAAAEPLGALLAACAAERLSGLFDAVTYVPISRERRRQRGYNQAELPALGHASESVPCQNRGQPAAVRTPGRGGALVQRHGRVPSRAGGERVGAAGPAH